jgi:hypothetical protein
LSFKPDYAAQFEEIMLNRLIQKGSISKSGLQGCSLVVKPERGVPKSREEYPA